MINYVKVRREIHVGQNPGVRFLARIFRNQDINLDTIAEEISSSTTMNYADVLGVLKALEQQISKHVLNGSAVRLGMLGAFVPSLQAKSVLDVDDCTSESIKKVRVLFKPSIKFKNVLSKASFQLKDTSIKGLVE